MRIRNNTGASFALRYTGTNRSALAKSLEKLSSGLAINRAGDDAAGLVISEKMRRQITGLGRAEKNSREGVKLIQVGEGALDEIHSMLNRAASLANQSANGVYDDEIDRQALQAELDELCEDIGRIAESANFNGVKLFQNKGLKYEQAAASTSAGTTARLASVASSTSSTQTASLRTLDDLLADQEKGDLNIVYFEDPINAKPSAGSPDPNNQPAASDPACDITVNGTNISQILKTQIVPQTVHNILTNYPAFSYLKDSAIGIGMRLYSDPNSSTLASVTLHTSYSTNGTGALGYMLSVNMGRVDTNKADWREDLEATIAHEMIHAFMDEATTAGMTGLVPEAGSVTNVGRFDSWFREGMAQTASGPDNWIHPFSGSGLQIDASSDDTKIRAQIQNHKLGTPQDSGADYGTGYLACMYLGWTIAGGGSVDAANISKGLSSLMNEVIGGKSLDAAIKDLTNGKFSSTSDFKNRFNTAGTDVTGFVHDLIVAKGNGRGGLASGDLADSDLTNDATLSGIKLFELDTGSSMITNTYPAGYVVLTGGTTSKDGVSPSDFNTNDYGDFIVKSSVPGSQGITWDQSTKTLTISAGNDVEITMKPGASGASHNLVVNGTGKVTLNGVKADSLTVKEDAKISYEGKNDIDAIAVDSGKTADFQGKGQLKAGTFTNGGAVSFNAGAVIVGGGSGTIGGAVKVDGASVAANITTPTAANGTTALEPIAIDWSRLPSGFNVASISVDGAKTGVPLDNGDPGKLWLDPATTSHRVTFTDENGVSKTLEAKYESGAFTWAAADRPFTVVGGTENTDYHYENDTTLVIDKPNAALTISGGSVTGANGTTLLGRIKLADNTGAVSLTLNGVDCSQNTDGSAFDLGEGNTVTLTLKDGTENKFTGEANFAGIAVGTGTKLTINGSTGKLNAAAGTGGTRGAAGIGRNGMQAASRGTDNTSSITINGGDITATGSVGGMSNPAGSGAGIGAGDHNDFGDITITGGTIHATGGARGGAGIGGANYASCGNILINDASGNAPTITAISNGHGAGIGGGWWDTINGTITISAGTITAESITHGTGIGAGCQGGSSCVSRSGKITINGTAVIESAQGGNSGAGIGSSSWGTCGDVEISGGAVVKKARGGADGAGIGSGSSSKVGNIIINTTGTVNAEGGSNGVGIGSGYNGSSSGKIEIRQGTVKAKGSTNSTGIGAGRNSTSGDITIGSDTGTTIVSAQGGMSNNGGNIMAYGDTGHNKPGKVTITGSGTTVRPGEVGEGLYSTSGVEDKDGNKRYAYPVYLFEKDGTNTTLDSGVGLNAADGTGLLPLDHTKVDIGSIQISSDKGDTWNLGLSHDPLDSDYVFVWLKPENQKLTISYEEDDGNGTLVPKTVDLDLIYYEDSGTFRIATQPKPPAAVKPGYDVTKPTPNPSNPPQPTKPEETWEGGIILQIGAEYGEILTVPQFYLSLDALDMGKLDISTQTNAWDSMPTIKNAINRVSSIRATYGALYNRLEHNQNQLRNEVENITDAESRIRDADMAEEMMAYTKKSILVQSAQAMLAQASQLPQGVLQLLS